MTQVIRISNGKPNAPALWIDGGIHAREWISPAAVTYIINHLVENSDNLEADYYILPVANPDGYVPRNGETTQFKQLLLLAIFFDS